MAESKITIISTVLFGKPTVSGTRLFVEQILACLSDVWTNAEIKKKFGLSGEDIKACTVFAHHSVSQILEL